MNDLISRQTGQVTQTNASNTLNTLDCISRQAAIDAINSHFGFNVEEEYGSAVQEVINSLPSAQPEPKWTPCEKALPKENGFYEVTVGSPYKPVRIYEYKPCDWYENKNRWRAEDGCYVFNWFVKAWKEYPKPYERSDNG